jgi:2-polyprenyl-6-methoxyphenol hydroxylase-like FAD-dependent oxidoreductase
MTQAKVSHAIVVGASMAGLLSARALSDHAGRVTVVERDTLPLQGESRKGVPQGNHAHGLLASGYRVMDAYFPGMMDELEAIGAPRGDVVGDFLWFQYGAWKLRHNSGLEGIVVSRPCLEGAVRSRVRALPNVTFLEDHDALHPVFDSAAGRVTGLAVKNRESGAEETIAADLVVDATGRGSQSPKWLDEWGFGRPPETVVKVDVGYATRIFERRPGDFRNAMGGIVAGTAPQSTRYAAVLAAEGPRWVVTLAGMLGDYPPATSAEWLEWAHTLPEPIVYDLVSQAKPLSEIVTYRFPANQRRHYEKMARFPGGYLVVGDAICSFNPIYGQGMSAAALESRALGETLAAGTDGLARLFFARASKIADVPWLIATGEDLRYPQVEGKRPPGFAIVSKYLERVHRVASWDPAVCRRFFDVANLLAPPTAVMAPGIARRVLFARAPRNAARAAGSQSAAGQAAGR